MKKSILWVAALAALQGGALFAQNLPGTWQGLMLVSQTPGDTLHVVFKISTVAGEASRGRCTVSIKAARPRRPISH